MISFMCNLYFLLQKTLTLQVLEGILSTEDNLDEFLSNLLINLSIYKQVNTVYSADDLYVHIKIVIYE